jgi:hypothetical protein
VLDRNVHGSSCNDVWPERTLNSSFHLSLGQDDW